MDSVLQALSSRTSSSSSFPLHSLLSSSTLIGMLTTVSLLLSSSSNPLDVSMATKTESNPKWKRIRDQNTSMTHLFQKKNHPKMVQNPETYNKSRNG